MSQQRTQIQIQTQVRLLDDVFHIAIIALERLEGYLLNKSNAIPVFTQVTGIGTSRDKHDDVANPPTEESILAEMQLQCSTLWFQTKTDDDERLQKTIKYFIEDLFSWYGGRKNLPFDEVEMFFIPLVGSLSRQITSVTDVMAIVKKYVTDKIKDLSEYSEEEKAQAVEKGFLAWIRGQAEMDERKQQYKMDGYNYELTSHQRGTVRDGYERLKVAMQDLYPEDALPTQFLEKIVKDYLPELLMEQLDSEDKSLNDFFDNDVQQLIKQHNTSQDRLRLNNLIRTMFANTN